MKKHFEEPVVEVIKVNLADVITTSGSGSPDWSDPTDPEIDW